MLFALWNFIKRLFSCCWCCKPWNPSSGALLGQRSPPVIELEQSKMLSYLHLVPLIQRLSEKDFKLLGSICKATRFKVGDVVIKQDDPGKEFFLICEGEARVTMHDRKAGTAREIVRLHAGDFFGENALLYEEPRMATVTAVTRLLTLRIARIDFESLGLNKKLPFAHRRAVHPGRERHRQLAKREAAEKSPTDRAAIARALRDCENLQALLGDERTRIEELVEAAHEEKVKKGQEVIVQGDLNADDFYVVKEGSFKVILSEENGPQINGAAREGLEHKIARTIGVGGCFGELALLYLTPRTATVVATVPGLVWAISRHHFKRILLQASDKSIEENVTLLSSVSILDCLSHDEKHRLADALVEMRFMKGEVVLEEGSSGNTFYILCNGEVSVQKGGQEIKRLRADPSSAQYFGERALLGNETRTATVKVTSDVATALVLDRGSFDVLLGPLAELLDRAKGCERNGTDQSFILDEPSRPRCTIRWDELGSSVGRLGTGSFGSVDLFLHRGMAYALKSLSKGHIVQMDMQESVKSEKDILLRCSSPFIITLYATYNRPQFVCLLMEFAAGGELYDVYVKKNFFGILDLTKFHMGGILLGIEHMHKLRFVNRDLKPENVVLNGRGYPKLIDMGLAKFLVGKTYTTCGTPDYFAPELISQCGHGFGVDWWAYGVTLFELMAGPPPFNAPEPILIFKKVMRGIDAVFFTPRTLGATERLVKALLKKRPSERLPMRMGGVKNLKGHEWFANFNWPALEHLTMSPPYIPRLKHSFNDYVIGKEMNPPRTVPFVDDGSGWDVAFATND